MVESKLFDMFPKQHIDKQLEIAYSDGTVTNKELFQESMELTESLCSENELRFGSCESSQIKFKIANVMLPMFSKEITVQMKVEGNDDSPLPIGKYKVVSDTPTADRRWRDIVAYDAMYDILNADVAAWYNETLTDMESKMPMRQFRKKFLEHFEIAEADPEQELVNDDMTVQRTIEPEEISGKDVITAICEINGCFGHINREGKFAYIYLPQMIQGLYPANDLYPDHAPDYLPYMQETGHLYPKDPKGIPLGKQGVYISCQYDDYLTKEIKRLQIRKEENDIGVIINEEKEGNAYIIEDNFLVYGKGTEEMRAIGEKIYSKISGIIYRPFSAEVQGNPCIEVGDPVRLSTQYQIVESYVLERTLKGIQTLRDTYTAAGAETYSENLNSVQKSIIELRGKSNVLTRTIEETKSTITDVEKGLQTQITQNAESITSEATRAQKKEEEIDGNVAKTEETLSSKIEQTADHITQEVDKQIQETKEYADGRVDSVNTSLSSKIEQTADSITQSVGKSVKQYDIGVYAGDIDLYGFTEPGEAGYPAAENWQKYYLNQSTGIVYMSNGTIWEDIFHGKLISSELSSQIEQNAEAIALRVTSEEAESLIEQKADSIRLKADKIAWESQNSSMTEDGKLTCQEADINGALHSQSFGGLFHVDIENGDISGGMGSEKSGRLAFGVIGSEANETLLESNNVLRLSAPSMAVSNGSSSYKCSSDSINVVTKINFDQDGRVSSYEHITLTFLNGFMITQIQ